MTNMERKEQLLAARQDVAEIFVKIDGEVENISPETFFKVTKGMFEVMKEVDHDISNGQASVRWELTNLVKGSGQTTFGIFSLQPGSNRAQTFRDLFLDGMRSIQARDSQRPFIFTDNVLKRIRKIIASLPKKENVVSLGVADAPLYVNMETVAQIDEWLDARYEAVGSIEGRLESVSSHDKLQCAIYDRFERKIDCYFTEDFKQQVKMGLYERVTIRGRISYQADGTPVSIKPESIIPLRQTIELPQPEDMFGIADYGMQSEDYVRSLRDE